MTEAEINAIVDKLADNARVLQDADPDDKAEIFRRLNLRLTYPPADTPKPRKSRQSARL
jgi:hypothetical protein